MARALTEGGISTTGWDDVSVTVRARDVAAVSLALAKIDPYTARPALPEDMVAALKFGLCLPPQVAEAVLVARTSNSGEIAQTVSRPARRIVALSSS